MLIVATNLPVDSSVCIERGFSVTGASDSVGEGDASVAVEFGMVVPVGLGMTVENGVADGIGGADDVSSISSADVALLTFISTVADVAW